MKERHDVEQHEVKQEDEYDLVKAPRRFHTFIPKYFFDCTMWDGLLHNKSMGGS